MVELPVSQFTVWMGWVTCVDNQVRSSSFIILWHPVFDEGIGWITALKTALAAFVWHLSERLYQLIIMSLGSFKAESGFDFKERGHAKEKSCFRNWRADPGKPVWETPCFIYLPPVSTASFFLINGPIILSSKQRWNLWTLIRAEVGCYKMQTGEIRHLPWGKYLIDCLQPTNRW